VKWTYYYLYVIIDIYSRYVPGWMLAHAENGRLAETFLADTFTKQHIRHGQLNVHSDNGGPMIAKPVAFSQPVTVPGTTLIPLPEATTPRKAHARSPRNCANPVPLAKPVAFAEPHVIAGRPGGGCERSGRWVISGHRPARLRSHHRNRAGGVCTGRSVGGPAESSIGAPPLSVEAPERALSISTAHVTR